MVKVTKKGKDSFEPVTIVLETQKEFDFMNGLFDANGDAVKNKCNDYDSELDYMFFDKLDDVRIVKNE